LTLIIFSSGERRSTHQPRSDGGRDFTTSPRLFAILIAMLWRPQLACLTLVGLVLHSPA
jgi:hypothetical protein